MENIQELLVSGTMLALAVFFMSRLFGVIKAVVAAAVLTAVILVLYSMGVDKNLIRAVGEVLFLLGTVLVLASLAAKLIKINFYVMTVALVLALSGALYNGNLKLKSISKYTSTLNRE